jgi:hypothetical protein
MRNVLIVAVMAAGLILIVVGASRADDLWQICEKRDGVWFPWVTPKGYPSLPVSQSACAVDLASARMVAGSNINLDCVKVSRARR